MVIPASIYVLVVTESDVVIPVTVLGSCWNTSSKPISGYLLIVKLSPVLTVSKISTSTTSCSDPR